MAVDAVFHFTVGFDFAFLITPEWISWRRAIGNPAIFYFICLITFLFCFLFACLFVICRSVHVLEEHWHTAISGTHCIGSEPPPPILKRAGRNRVHTYVRGEAKSKLPEKQFIQRQINRRCWNKQKCGAPDAWAWWAKSVNCLSLPTAPPGQVWQDV